MNPKNLGKEQKTYFDKSWYLQEDCEMVRQMFCEMVDMDYEEALDLGREEFEKLKRKRKLNQKPK